jgi:hypothetical protein
MHGTLGAKPRKADLPGKARGSRVFGLIPRSASHPRRSRTKRKRFSTRGPHSRCCLPLRSAVRRICVVATAEPSHGWTAPRFPGRAGRNRARIDHRAAPCPIRGQPGRAPPGSWRGDPRGGDRRSDRQASGRKCGIRRELRVGRGTRPGGRPRAARGLAHRRGAAHETAGGEAPPHRRWGGSPSHPGGHHRGVPVAGGGDRAPTGAHPGAAPGDPQLRVLQERRSTRALAAQQLLPGRPRQGTVAVQPWQGEYESPPLPWPGSPGGAT